MSSQTSSPDPGEEPKKRQRIQQACKSCGLKRVKCNGQHPCNTCVRTGDRCDYGMPKKRGPPKGSTRSSAKNANAKSPTDLYAGPSSLHTAPTGFDTQRSHMGAQPGVGPSQSSDVPLYSPSMRTNDATARYASSPLASSASPSHQTFSGRSDSSVASTSFQAHPPGAQFQRLPQATHLLTNARQGSYVSLPGISGFTKPKFRGGSSGILDFPSPGAARSQYYPAHSPSEGSAIGLTSPSSFSLNKRPLEDVSSPLSQGSVAARAPGISPLARLPSWSSMRSDSNQGANDPSSSTSASGPVIANIFVNSLDIAGHDPRSSGSMDSVPRCIHHPRVPEAIEDSVWNLWWQLIAMHWPILVRDVLPPIRGLPRVDAEKHPLLYNAVAALASRVWDEERDGSLAPMESADGTAVRPPTPEELSDIYFLRARYWLLKNDCESSLDTAQALLCMSLRESGSGHPSHSAEYCMSACRTALDLGLHREFTNKGLPLVEQQARLRTWWCIYILDKTNSAMLGRPCVLRYDECDVPYPEVNIPEEHAGWQPSAHDHSKASKILAGQPVRALSYLEYGSMLATICESIILQHNQVRHRGSLSSQDRQSVPEGVIDQPWAVMVTRLHFRIEEWERSLPSCLREHPGQPTFQHVLCQRMWASVCRIILHRPFILKPSAHPSIPPAYTVCNQGARDVCRLVATYKRDHGIRKLSSTLVYCVFTAATIFLADITSPDVQTAQEAKRYLAECTQHLGNMGGTWTNATVHLEILHHLGRSVDADLAGTGLDMVRGVIPPAFEGANARGGRGDASAPASSGNAASDHVSGGFGVPANGLNLAMSESHDPLTCRPTADAGGGGGGAAAPSATANAGIFNGGLPADTNGASAYVADAPRVRSGLSEDRFFEINDQSYWGAMPLSSENPQDWHTFTTQWKQAMNAANMAVVAPVIKS